MITEQTQLKVSKIRLIGSKRKEGEGGGGGGVVPLFQGNMDHTGEVGST